MAFFSAMHMTSKFITACDTATRMTGISVLRPTSHGHLHSNHCPTPLCVSPTDRADVERIKESGKRLFVPFLVPQLCQTPFPKHFARSTCCDVQAQELGGQRDIWLQRPMLDLLCDYAAVDVRYLLAACASVVRGAHQRV
eukprot:918643-Amphidinium_carterae.1